MPVIKIQFKVTDKMIHNNSLHQFLTLIRSDAPSIMQKVEDAAKRCYLASHREKIGEPTAPVVMDENTVIEPEGGNDREDDISGEEPEPAEED